MNIENIFIEINLRKVKWILFGGYNPRKENTTDFNSQTDKNITNEFCQTYNLKNLINEPTCVKTPLNPSTIDVILTNKVSSFSNNCTLETGLSDQHKMTITVLKSFFINKLQ